MRRPRGTPPRYVLSLILGMGLVGLAGCYTLLPGNGGNINHFCPPREVDPADVAVPPGYCIEAVAVNLVFPTAVIVDDCDRVHVVESGYSYGEVFTTPRLLRVEPDGQLTVIAVGRNNGPWTGGSYHRGAFYISEGGELEGGRILRITPDGQITTLVEDLPSRGDHHTNRPVVGPDGYVYFGVGTHTNSGVVGPDNYYAGWLKRYPGLHDVPGQDIVLTGQNFTSHNPLTSDPLDKVATGAFVPFGTLTTAGQVIPGRLPCNGAIMRVPATGGPLELVAWGFRNPFSLAFAPDGRLFATENSYDVRGSRPIFGTGDLLWCVQPGLWYGWPDFWAGEPLIHPRFRPEPGLKPQPQFLLAQHPNCPPQPVARLGVRSSSNGLDFSRCPAFGHVGEAFIAVYGDHTGIGMGKVNQPVGFRVVRVNVGNGVIEDFLVNKSGNGPASKVGGGGLERPVDVRFSNDGTTLYVADFGVMTASLTGPWPYPGTGVLWRVRRAGPPMP